MKAVALTDKGLERPVNQDYVYVNLDEVGSLPNLFIVADGMGGHKAGDTASKYTVETFTSLINQSESKDPILAISNSVIRVNRMLLEKASESEDYDGMGTTLVVATISGDRLRVANVGDSRLYIVNDDIVQITRDHSLVEEMVQLGQINRQEARNHEKKNYITRAIGGCEDVEAEMFSVDLKKNDKILMCSDGLTNMVEDKDVLDIINKSDSIEDAARTLVDTANRNGGKDNISVIIVEP
ncbi:MAG: Stp1/IreP family PP2C-type Ser/Thr phosphatase [Eubacteriales bacterium]|nr:Stp1/IreP family PP2C-type Ser/Thr phosphatase [Eubacteriales bacterium]